MNTYYVTHPGVDRSSIVHAPTTEKARTTFLDWLERNNYISRIQRQGLRKNMVANRLDGPVNWPTDSELYYGYTDTMGPPDPTDPSSLGFGISGYGDTPMEDTRPLMEPPQASQEVSPKRSKSPIADAALRGLVR